MTSKRLGPEGARRAGGESESDVEGHGRRADAADAVPTDQPGTGPQDSHPRAIEDGDDVEGHNFGHNAMISRSAAQSREREVQRNLKQHELKGEARRPFLKGR